MTKQVDNFDSQSENASPRRTVVGGRPPSTPCFLTGLPRGIQEAIALASKDDAFRERLLADPEGVAGEKLNSSERAILRAVPKDQLAFMIDRIRGVERDRQRFFKTAAASISLAAALACSQDASAGDQTPKTRGILSDDPTIQRPTPASVSANKTAQPNEVRFALSASRRNCSPTLIIVVEQTSLSLDDASRPRLSDVCNSLFGNAAPSDSLKKAVSAAQLSGAIMPVAGFPNADAFTDDPVMRATWARSVLIGSGDCPAAVFLAPDGSVLLKQTKPADVNALIEAIGQALQANNKWKRAHPGVVHPLTRGMFLDDTNFRQETSAGF
jgi:hypothetical protein